MVLYDDSPREGDRVRLVQEAMGASYGELSLQACDCVEPVMAVKKSYRNIGKKEKPAELSPQLQKEIAAKTTEYNKRDAGGGKR